MSYIKDVIMRKWFPRLRQSAGVQRPSRPQSFRPMLEVLEERSLLDAGMSGFTMTNLLSDIPGVAAHTDAQLINPWGFAETPQGQFQIAVNGTGITLHVDARGHVIGAPVVLQPPLGSPPGTTTTPNGIVPNSTSDFVISDDGNTAPAQYIFSTEDGTLVAFNPSVDPKEGILVAQSSDGAVYKLLAPLSNAKGNFLMATDFHNNKIDVFDKNFDKVTLGQNGWGNFQDPNEPAGFAPFGVKQLTINGQSVVLVAYAKQDAEGHDDVAGVGNGFIDEFDTSGNFIKRFATGSAVGGTVPLDSPIAMTIAPAGFGPQGNPGDTVMLISNFGDSQVSAFDLNTGKYLGQLSDAKGNPLTLNGGITNADPTDTKGLWGIAFGNGHGGTDPNALYFAAGVHDENDGVFGKVSMSNGNDDHGHDHDDAMTANHAASVQQQVASAQNSMAMMSNTTMQSPTMMQSSNVMSQTTGNTTMQTQIDALFQMLDADLISLESKILAQMPQLDGLIQSYNAAVTMVESAIAGHSIDDLSGKV